MTLLSFACRHRYDSGFVLDIAFETTHPITSLFGPSGSGKTSVLSIIAGFLQPDNGHVHLGDRTLLDTSARIGEPCEKRHIGVVFQDHLLFPHLSVEANLRYGQRRRKNSPRSIDFARVCHVLELDELLQRYPARLSGGERQRVAVGRALLSSPELLLMDEPLASLDAELKSRILAYLERVMQEWTIPTIYVSHSQSEVRRLAGWVVVIDKGQVVASGTPDDALAASRPLAWKNSLGPTNLLRLEQLQQRDGHWVGRIGTQELHLPPIKAPVSSPLFVEFTPNEVILSRHDVTGLSTRNHLRGQIRHIVELPDGVFIAVDIGQIIWSEVTAEAAAELDMHIGVEIVCLIKTHSLRVLT